MILAAPVAGSLVARAGNRVPAIVVALLVATLADPQWRRESKDVATTLEGMNILTDCVLSAVWPT